MSKESAQRSGFKPTLELFDTTPISVGAIIGAGISVVTGMAAGCAGSALIVSMLTVIGAATCLALLVFVLFASFQSRIIGAVTLLT